MPRQKSNWSTNKECRATVTEPMVSPATYRLIRLSSVSTGKAPPPAGNHRPAILSVCRALYREEAGPTNDQTRSFI